MSAAFITLTPQELQGLRDDPENVSKLFFDRLALHDGAQALDIDKSWHGIHFLLTGEKYGGDPPGSLPVLGGTEIGPDLGYGPARYLTPSEVKKSAEHLSTLPPDVLRTRFVPSELEGADIYPTGIWQEDGDQVFKYLAHWYERLRSFYSQASSRGSAVLLAIV